MHNVYKHTVEEEKAVVKLFRLSSNTFYCTVSHSIYQGAVFKATEIIIIKKINATLTSPAGVWGGR